MYLLYNLCYFFIIAPGSYDVEKVEKTVHQSSPAYSFGVKYREKSPEHLPGMFVETYTNI